MNEEAKTAKLLERVQGQMAEFVYPVLQLTQFFTRAFERAAFECGCERHMAAYAVEWFSPPTQPHATLFDIGNPAMFKQFAANPCAYTLPPQDLARLAEDPTRRGRWEELMVHAALPSLRKLLPILEAKVRTCAGTDGFPVRGTFCFPCVVVRNLALTPVAVRGPQFHLADLGEPNALNGMLPGLGRDWTDFLGGSLGHVFRLLPLYAMEWEAVVARWARDDHKMLQPAEPCWVLTTVYCIALMRNKTAKKELELCAMPTIL